MMAYVGKLENNSVLLIDNIGLVKKQVVIDIVVYYQNLRFLMQDGKYVIYIYIYIKINIYI